MIKLGYTEKQIKAYFKENKEVWSDIDLKKIDMYYFTKETSGRFFATRKNIDTTYDDKKIRGEITDTAIQKIMLNHLAKYEGKPILAFSPDGIDEMNRNIKELNGGNFHQPIYKVRVYEEAEKFTVGQKGNKKTKFVEAAKGTNLFFAIYEIDVLDKKTGKMIKKRSFRTIPLNEAISKMKAGLQLDEEAAFILSPNDLVYLPTENDIESGEIINIDYSRLYKFVSAAGTKADFVPVTASNVIFNVKKEFSETFCKKEIIKNEFGVGSPKSKNERALTGEMIKEVCIPLKVDRLGHIIKIGV